MKTPIMKIMLLRMESFLSKTSKQLLAISTLSLVFEGFGELFLES